MSTNKSNNNSKTTVSPKADNIDWNHPIVKLAGIIPAAVVCDTFGYRQTYFTRACRLPRNAGIVIKRNGTYWLRVDRIADFDPNHKNAHAEGGEQ